MAKDPYKGKEKSEPKSYEKKEGAPKKANPFIKKGK